MAGDRGGPGRVRACAGGDRGRGIEPLNARFGTAVRRRGHFPTEQAALKILYLTIRERIPNRANPTGKING
jgi:putative transposase